ncbi:MAG: GTP 3',8-cyclase MoaA [Bacillota bacterium]
MRDGYQREIDYLRVSVTDRCNLRCRYCLPPEGVPLLPHAEILSFEEIERVVQAASLVGVKKVRLTGGEPLVRQDLVRLVARLAGIDGIEDLALTTNGILLSRYAGGLKAAGLKRVNISLDTLQPERYTWITRGGKLTDLWRGVESALETGLNPVKLNVVVIGGFNDDEIPDLAALSLKYPLHVRFIELMPYGPASEWGGKSFVPNSRVRFQIEAAFGDLVEVRKPTGNGPACYWRIRGAPGTVGFISPVSEHICSRCNRLRLTAVGKLRPCLFRQEETDVKGLLRKGANLEELVALVAQVIKSKRERKARSVPGVMVRIGGRMAKRRGRGEGSITKRKDGRWEAKASIGYDPGTGKLKRVTKCFKTRQEAAVWLCILVQK